ncbi:MAG TPA: response regulator transcription factor [Candidatus Acidoferrales bacterium]|nr:response regulator transcription factor [Candidatus Acidoferrales bacterium]
MAAITIRVFASHPVAAQQFARLLAAEPDFMLVADDEPFQVGVFDTASASAETVMTLARLKFPAMRPVLVAAPCDETECLRWLFRGAWGLVNYDHYQQELPRAVRQLAGGQLWFPAPVVVRWMRIDAARRSSALRVSLTRRERQILEFLLRRFSNREIAEILNISERTVKFHVSNVLGKLQVTSRQELVASRVPHLGLT